MIDSATTVHKVECTYFKVWGRGVICLNLVCSSVFIVMSIRSLEGLERVGFASLYMIRVINCIQVLGLNTATNYAIFKRRRKRRRKLNADEVQPVLNSQIKVTIHSHFLAIPILSRRK